ncbi:MAG: hypothetical protein ACI4A5_03090 [Hominilimicola sp.]
MKKKVILIAVIIGALSEIAAVIYTIHTRNKAVFGGEYFILPLIMMCAYIVTEIIGAAERKKKTEVRLTRRTKYGDAVLNYEAFPEYAEETLIHEVNCFEPMKTAVEKLCEYEEMGGN